MSLEIEVPVAELKSVLPGLSKVVNRTSTLPVLGCVRATVEDNQVKLQVTNLEDTATVSLGGRGSGNGAVLVPLEELSKVSKTCAPADTIRLRATKEGVTINYPIGSNRVDRRLSVFDLKEWPATVAQIDEPSIPVDDKLKSALLDALNASSEDSSRYVLQGAYLDTEDPKGHYVVGCDGHLLFSANSFKFDLKESLIVPNRKFLHWRGFLEDNNCQLSSLPSVEGKPVENGKPAVEGRPGYVQFKSDRWTFVTRQIVGQYPKWKQVIPSEWKTTVQLSNEAVQFILDAVPKMPCPNTEHEAIHLVVDGKSFALSAKTQDNDPWTTLQVPGASVEGEPVTVALNRNFLLKALKLGLDEIKFADALSPVMFKKDGRRLVVMVLKPENAPASESEEPAPTKPVPAPQNDQPAAPVTATQPQTKETTMPEKETQAETKSPKVANPQSAYDQLQESVEKIRTTLKAVVSDLNDLSKIVSQAYREKRATEKEIESIRETLNEIRRLKI